VTPRAHRRSVGDAHRERSLHPALAVHRFEFKLHLVQEMEATAARLRAAAEAKPMRLPVNRRVDETHHVLTPDGLSVWYTIQVLAAQPHPGSHLRAHRPHAHGRRVHAVARPPHRGRQPVEAPGMPGSMTRRFEAFERSPELGAARLMALTASVIQELRRIVGRESVIDSANDLRILSATPPIEGAMARGRSPSLLDRSGGERHQVAAKIKFRSCLAARARALGRRGLRFARHRAAGDAYAAHPRARPIAQTALVEPGVVKPGAVLAASAHGLFYAPDPSSQKACTIGGNAARLRRPPLPLLRRHHQPRPRHGRSCLPTAASTG